MGVEVRMTTSVDDIQRYLEQETRKHIHRVIATLQYVGEQVVNGIRDGSMSNWNDQTGNLRSSIGYIVAIDGVPEHESSFDQVGGPNRPEKSADANGGERGLAYARQLASLHPKGISLIVVAGMEYASYVEAMDNKAVLAQGEIEARKLIREMIAELNRNKGSEK